MSISPASEILTSPPRSQPHKPEAEEECGVGFGDECPVGGDGVERGTGAHRPGPRVGEVCLNAVVRLRVRTIGIPPYKTCSEVVRAVQVRAAKVRALHGHVLQVRASQVRVD